MAKRCWLCEYSDDPVARQVSKYISDQAVMMGPELMAERVHESLAEQCPMAEGIGLDEIKEHIMIHTLTPGVRIACIMRSLLKLTNSLEGVLSSNDPETGLTTVDPKSIAIYLKVISEVMQMYKTGEVNRLMFAQDTKATP